MYGMHRILLLIVVLFMHSTALFGQKSFLSNSNGYATPTYKLRWGDWETTRQASGTKSKTLISIYTNWCNWCKKMDAETFTHRGVAEYLNEHYNLVQFDAEQRTEITFNGRTYGQAKVGTRAYNELAYTLLNGRMTFPALVFLDEDLKVIQVIPGFKTPQELMPILVYFGSNEYKVKPWALFQKQYKMPE